MSKDKNKYMSFRKVTGNLVLNIVLFMSANNDAASNLPGDDRL